MSEAIAQFVLENPKRAFAIGWIVGMLVAFIALYVYNVTRSRVAILIAGATTLVVIPCLAGMSWGGIAALVAFGIFALIAAVAGIAVLVGVIRDRRWSRRQA
ncbi:hypothetical protein [Leifsonia shinshuensis]